MNPEKNKVEFDSATQRYIVYYNGSIIHRSKTQEGADKTLSRMCSLEREKEAEQVNTVAATGPVVAHNPFANAVDFADFKYDADKIKELVNLDLTAMIPKKDPNFVPFGNYNDVEMIIKSGIFYPAYVSGPTGNGKSSMVEHICARHKKPLIRLNMNMMTDEEVLIGSKTLKNGNVEIVEGPVLIAMRTGATLLLDEIDAAAANTIMCLQSILEGKPYYFKLKNELITPAPGFNIIATANTKGKGSENGGYVGTNILNEAFLERFAVTFNQEYPSAAIEKKIIEKLFGTYGIDDIPFADLLVKWSEGIRRTYDNGGCDETITTRRISHIVRAYAIYRSRDKAVELCCNRFDASTKNAFMDLFRKMTPAPAVKFSNNF